MSHKPKWEIGDVVEFIPGNYLHVAYNARYWMEGVGIVMGVDEKEYLIQVYNLTKTSAKNLSTYDIGARLIRLPIEETDRAECFRLFDY